MSAHAPVMLGEAVEALAVRDGGLYIDATFGGGGYARAILAGGGRVLALDRDPGVRTIGERLKAAHPGRFVLVETPFSNMEAIVLDSGGDDVDGVIMDLGVSSMQLDQAERGFSFRHDGPLDMRMGRDGLSARDFVNAASERELADVIYAYGEERRSRRVAAAIVAARAEAAIETTAALAHLVERAVGPGDGRIHPATRTFQALRIHVNDELGELARALFAAERILKAGGRLSVVSFHSLEDRIVKTFLKRRCGLESGGSRHLPPVAQGPEPSFRLLFSRPKTAHAEEVNDNPRSRSAKLRVGVRTSVDAWPEDDDLVPHIGAAQEPAT